MSMTIDLSSTLRHKLATVAWRIRLLRTLRGSGLLLLTLAVTGGAALLADYFLNLPAAVRIGLFAAWLSLGLAVALVALVLPLRRCSTAPPWPPSLRRNIPNWANASPVPSSWPRRRTPSTARRP